MRILQLTNKPIIPTTDGGTLAMRSLTQSLVDLGYEVAVFSLYSPKHPKDEKAFKKRFPAVQQKHHFVESLPTLLGTLQHGILKKEYHSKRFYDIKVERDLEDFIQRFNPEIILLDNPFMMNYLSVIREHSSAKIIYRAHNVEFDLWQKRAEGENFFKKFILTRLAEELKQKEVELINSVDEVWTISSIDQSFLSQLTSKPIVQVAYGHEKQVSKSTPVNFHKVGFIGALDWEPNVEAIEWFIDKVWPLVLEKSPKMELHIAGRNGSTDYSNTEQNIVYHGEVESSTEFMLEHPLQVAPLMAGSGIRIKILEAMSLGLPVVTSTLGAQGIEDTSSLRLADSAEDFAQQILTLNKESKEREKLMSKAASVFSKYHDISVVKKVIKKQIEVV